MTPIHIINHKKGQIFKICVTHNGKVGGDVEKINILSKIYENNIGAPKCKQFFTIAPCKATYCNSWKGDNYRESNTEKKKLSDVISD